MRDEARIKENNGEPLLDLMSSDGTTVKDSEQETDSAVCGLRQLGQCLSSGCHD